MSILACISLVIVDSFVIVDNLPLTDESNITRGDCTAETILVFFLATFFDLQTISFLFFMLMIAKHPVNFYDSL